MIAELVALCTQLFEMAGELRDDRPCHSFHRRVVTCQFFAGKCAHWYVAVHRSPVWSHYSCPCSWRSLRSDRTPMASVTEVALPRASCTAATALPRPLSGLQPAYCARFISVFSVAGAFVDFSGGFSMGAMFDPLSGSSAAIISRAYTMLATVLIYLHRRPHCSCGWLHAHLQSAPLRALD